MLTIIAELFLFIGLATERIGELQKEKQEEERRLAVKSARHRDIDSAARFGLE